MAASKTSKEFTHNGWTIQTFKAPISPQADIEKFEELHNAKAPEIPFLSNGLFIAHEATGRKFRLDSVDVLRTASFSWNDSECTPDAPEALQVSEAQQWTNKSSSEVAVVELPSDWTFTPRSAYAGAVIFANDIEQNWHNTEKNLDYTLLRREDIPILHFDSVTLFEDELHDHGRCFCEAKMVCFCSRSIVSPSFISA